MLKFDVITLFPQLFEPFMATLPLKRALEKELIAVNLHNLRDFSKDSYKTVDDKPYGGGVGMVLMIEPIFDALENIKAKQEIVLLSPSGRKFTQSIARDYANKEQITLICGRYEGVDARVQEHLVTDVLSLGDFVLSGGEIPALAVIESVTRLLPGVLEKEEAAVLESFSEGQETTIEYPQYTRPEEFKGMKVPEVLLSGNHKEIEKWRKDNSRLTTDLPAQAGC